MFTIIIFLLFIFIGVFFYIKSVSPAFLETRFGSKAYNYCAVYRQIASLFLNTNFLCYIEIKQMNIYPPINQFPWNYNISLILALLIAIPGLYLFVKGRKNLGSESISPEKSNTLVLDGVYQRIRHPQAFGEISLWFVWSFILNSPALVLISIVWIPIYYLMCLAEERDLLIRFGKTYSNYIINSGFFLPRTYSGDKTYLKYSNSQNIK